MALHNRSPILTNPNIVIRLAHSREEIQQANQLVFRNYVERGFWQDDPAVIEQNRYLHLPARRVLLAMEHSAILATMSIILDSQAGLPADGFHPTTTAALRRDGERLAELSALAVDRDRVRPRHLVDFLFAFAFQYGYFYADLDRFAMVCHPKHARFHAHRYGFEPIDSAAVYEYVNAPGQMLTRNLRAGFAATANGSSEPESELDQFLYLERHASLQLPPDAEMESRRNVQWTRYARQHLPQAV